MLTRLWQHRYYGLIATILLGLSAAVIVMLLPDRQQAFARFMLEPSAASILRPTDAVAAAPSSLLDDQRIIAKVLQRIEIETPNPVDPRPVDPIDAYKRNFALRSTTRTNEFEISYVGRSVEMAALGVQTWLQAASEVIAQGQAARPVTGDDAAAQAAAKPLTPIESRAADQLAALQQTLHQVEAELASSRETETNSNKTLTKVQGDLTAAREALRGVEAELKTLAAGQQAQADQQRERDAARERIARLTAVQTEAQQAQRAAAGQLADAQARLQEARDQARKQADQASSAEAAKTRNTLRNRLQRLERQASAMQRELDEATERSAVLSAELEEAPETVTVIVDGPEAAPVGNPQADARLAEATRKLAELRVRFTDSHPDVRRQLSILEELKASAATRVQPAPMVRARSEQRPNPRQQGLRDSLASNESRLLDLRKRMNELRRSQQQTSARLQALDDAQAVAEPVAGAGPDPVVPAGLEQAVAQARDSANQADAAYEAAVSAVQEAQQTQADAKADSPAGNPTDNATGAIAEATAPGGQDAAARARRDELVAQIKTLEAALVKAEKAANAARLDAEQAEKTVTRARRSLEQARSEQDADKSRVADKDKAAGKADEPAPGATAAEPVPGILAAGFVVISPPQVVPASSNPDRPYWLWISLASSLLLGALTAGLVSLRPAGIHSVSELERITGLRALGGVPRFASGTRTLRVLFGMLFFLVLLLAYVVLYIGFIGLVESSGSLLAPDWHALRQWVQALVSSGISRLGLEGPVPGLEWLRLEEVNGKR